MRKEEGLSDNALIAFESPIVDAGGGVDTYYDVSADEVVKSEVVVGKDGLTTPSSASTGGTAKPRGELAEKVNTIVIRGGEVVAYAEVFFGRLPYGPWAELFNLRVLGTPVEAELYRLFAKYMEAEDLLYVEYLDDGKTARQLATGVPPGESRMRRLLESCGFRVVRDWYRWRAPPSSGPLGYLSLSLR
ncbi:DUF1122 family protein [Pyrobaculum islandicum]|uniref:DUF1122 family protein n=1 Tax=Pyrobaculum islandicum TaxID=2277 RepID=UPI001FD7F07B|nr:DUF1122 family protein [Pyrobaculum islandicum]